MIVTITAKSPIAHGAFGESAGNAMLCRRISLVSAPGMPRVPCLSGNSLRGRMRRIVFRDLFQRAGLDRTSLPHPQWDRMYAALANGGHLEASEKRIDPEAIRKLRAELPPLSCFGAALYSWLLPGHMSIGIAWPLCHETVSCGLLRGGKNLPRAEDLVEEISQVRHVDREFQDTTVTGVTPMPVTIEAISTGATFVSEVSFAAHATEVERGAACWALLRLEAIGGKSGSGFGRVQVAIDNDESPAYVDWLESADLTVLHRIAEDLAPTKAAPKKKAKQK